MDQKTVQKIGKYEIVAELGQGGMGVVYKARDPFIGRLVALKTITPELVSDPEILKRFYREAQSAGTLQHPNIVTIYDLGEADGRPYIAMEFVEGESLQSIINRRARIPLAAKLKLVQQFCEGLDHAHKHGFVHRDVKPANILVTNDGVVKVVDFGIVHLESTNLTKTGMFLGTIHYASPEQINDGRVDSRSDLWSVTAVVYEFIAYKKAFDGSNIAAIIAKVLSAEPEPLSRLCPGVPVELDNVISKGLKKNIEERYQSLDEMLGGLLPIARGLQMTFIGDLLLEAKDLRDKGDYNGAQEKVRAVLILDNTHAEAKRLFSEVSSEIHRVGPQQRAKKLVSEAEQAYNRGEFAEAVKMLTEAAELNPADTQARNLKEKAIREQERQKELHEAFSDGQKSMKQGDLTRAEHAFNRVLQIDQSHSQAAQFLQEIQQDRRTRERDFRLKEVLWETDNLISAAKYEEAQGRLLEIQQDFPDSQDVAQRLQSLDTLVRAQKLVQDGERAFNQGEYAEAVRALTQALEVNPQDAAALDLRERAVQERDRLRQVREALSNGQRAMRQGDTAAAEQEFMKALQLDPENSQATSLMAQIRQSQMSRERENHFQQVVQHADQLVAEGKFEDAQHTLTELQQEFPDSNEVHLKLQRLDQQMRVGGLVASGQQAFDQGEFGEAVRIFTEALDLDPGNAQVRDLKTKAAQERDRLRQVREAISAGQKAMRAGDAAAAEREYQRALQLDPNNSQAKNLLEQIAKDRPAGAAVAAPAAPVAAKEKGKALDARAMEILAQADRLMARKKFDEAKRKLKDLQRSYPDSEEIQEKLQAATERRIPAAAGPAPPPPPPAEAPAVGGSPLSEAARLEHLTEELRRNLQTPSPRAAESAPKAKTPAPAPVPPPSPAPELNATVPVGAPPVQAPPVIEATRPMKAAPPLEAPPPPETTRPMQAASPFQATQMTELPPAAGGFSATSMMPTAKLKAPAAPEVLPPPPEPPARKPATPPPGAAKAPAAPQVEKKPVPAPAPMPPLPKPAPAVIAQAEPAKKPPIIMIAAIVLVVIMAIGGYMAFHGHKTTETVTPGGNPPAGNPEVTKDQQEKDLMAKAQAAADKQDWKTAEDEYNQVIAMNGKLFKDASAALGTVKLQEQGTSKADAEAKDFKDGMAAYKLGPKHYENAKADLQQVVSLNIPDSPNIQKAKDTIADIDNYLNAQAEYQAADNLVNRSDYDGAISKMQGIAGGGGPFAQQAKRRAQEIQQLKTEVTANQALKTDFDAATRLEENGDLKGALAKFQQIQPKGGSFGAEATKHIQSINDTLAKQNADSDWKYALAEESSNPQDALSKMKDIAGRPGLHQDDAKLQIPQLQQTISNQKDIDTFNDALAKQKAGDMASLQAALAEFKGLAGKPGPKATDAIDHYGQVKNAIEAINTPKTEPPKPVVTQPSQPTTPPTTTTTSAARTPTVTPLPGGDPQPFRLSWYKGIIIPDYNVDGGLQAAGQLTVPPQTAPAGSFVLLKISIDENGSVAPNQIVNDTSGAGEEVKKAASSWKFKPPTAKGKPVKTSITVKVTF